MGDYKKDEMKEKIREVIADLQYIPVGGQPVSAREANREIMAHCIAMLEDVANVPKPRRVERIAK